MLFNKYCDLSVLVDVLEFLWKNIYDLDSRQPYVGTDNDHFSPTTRCSELSINLLDDKPLDEALMECILQVLVDVNDSGSAIRTALWCIYFKFISVRSITQSSKNSSRYHRRWKEVEKPGKNRCRNSHSLTLLPSKSMQGRNEIWYFLFRFINILLLEEQRLPYIL